MSKARSHYSPEFKAKVVIELLREEHTVNELAAKRGKMEPPAVY